MIARSRARGRRPSSPSSGRIGRLVQRLQVVGEAPHVVEDLGRRVGVGGRSGCRPRRRIAAPAATSSPPIQRASTGLPSMLGEAASAARRCAVGSVMACGRQDHQQAVARAGRAAAISSALAYRSGGGVAEDVDRVVVAPGRRQDRVERVHRRARRARRARRRRRSGHRSRARPGRRRWSRWSGAGRAAGAAWRAPRPCRTGRRCCSTRSTPTAPEGGVEHLVASRSASRCARRPPWPPASVRPGLITMIGLVRATSRAADRKARASPIVSM